MPQHRAGNRGNERGFHSSSLILNCYSPRVSKQVLFRRQQRCRVTIANFQKTRGARESKDSGKRGRLPEMPSLLKPTRVQRYLKLLKLTLWIRDRLPLVPGTVLPLGVNTGRVPVSRVSPALSRGGTGKQPNTNPPRLCWRWDKGWMTLRGRRASGQ